MQERQLREAVALLRDDGLVWSEDFETIRLALADLLAKIAQLPTAQLDDELDELLARLLHTDHLPTKIPDALERWVKDGARELGIYQDATDSPAFRDLVRRFFRL
jgi:hypothetical protein